MSYQFSNNATTTLSGAITAGDTTLSVVSAAGFPASGDFTIVIDSEILLVTGIAGSTWTVARGAEGTTAAAHSAGASVTHVLTAAALKDGLVQSGISFPASPATNDRFYRNDLRGEYVYDGTRWASASLLVKTFIPIMLPPYSLAGTVMYLPAEGGNDWWIEDAVIFSKVTDTNNPSNRWDISVLSVDGGGAIVSTLATFSSVTTAPFQSQRAAIGALSGSTIEWLAVSIAKIGTPGTLDWLAARVTYRAIGN